MRRQLAAHSTASAPNAVDRALHGITVPFTDSGPVDGLATFSDYGYSGGSAPSIAMVQTAGAAARCALLQGAMRPGIVIRDVKFVSTAQQLMLNRGLFMKLMGATRSSKNSTPVSDAWLTASVPKEVWISFI
jgi:hypothetical protein